MKILHVNHLLGTETGGGTAERTFQLSRFLAKKGPNCAVLTLDIGITSERREALESVRIVALPCINRRFFLPKFSRRQIDGLVSDFDVVHLSGHWTVLNALVFQSCRRQRKPYVFCPAGALKRFGRSLRLKALYDAWIGRRIVRSASAWVAITAEERADFARYGVEPQHVTVIPNGIDPDQYNWAHDFEAMERFRSALGTAHHRYLLFLGRLNAIKGPDLLLDAFSRVADSFPDLHLVFAGPDGGLQTQLKAECAERLLTSRVHFVGYLAGEAKTAALHGATLLVIPSRHEAMSIVVLEAGICRTAVLFTSACGLDDIAQAGAGTEVEPTASAIAASLSALLSSPTTIRTNAEKLSELVQAHYLWSHQADRYLALYRGMVRNSA